MAGPTNGGHRVCLSMADRGRERRGKKASGGWESVEVVEEDRESSLALVHNGAERGQGKVEVAAMERLNSCMVATSRTRAGL